MGPTIEASDNEPRDDELDLRDPGSDVDVGVNADIDEVDESELVGTGEDEDMIALEGDGHTQDDDRGSVSSSRDTSVVEGRVSGSISDGTERRLRPRSRERVHDSVDDLGSIPDDTPSIQVCIDSFICLQRKRTSSLIFLYRTQWSPHPEAVPLCTADQLQT